MLRFLRWRNAYLEAPVNNDVDIVERERRVRAETNPRQYADHHLGVEEHG